MALITKLREKLGKVIVGAVGLAILSFVLADLTGPNSVLLGGRDLTVAEISGQEVPLEVYQRKIDELSYNFTLNQGRNPSANESNTLRQQAWDLVIVETAFGEQFRQLGLQVTQDEVVDMVQGKNISFDIQRAFSNPQTGEFDRQVVINYLKNLSQLPAQQQRLWYSFENSLGPGRLRIKYDNILVKSVFTTTEEARNEYDFQNRSADVKYIYIPYLSIADSLVEVSDDDLSTYLENNSERYQVENSRSLSYVSFPIIPSSEDSAYSQTEIAQLKSELEEISEDSVFARVNTDGQDFFVSYRPGNLPEIISTKLDTLQIGDVIGPLLENNIYEVYKFSALGEDTAYAARAKHILINPDSDPNQTKEQAESEARRILREIKNGADFSEMALAHGSDGTASQGGDLGWFEEGRMVPPFEAAVFNATRTGLIEDVVETDFGYHVVEVTELKTNQLYKIAKVTREITPSDETRDAAYRGADYFAGTSIELVTFRANAARDSLAILSADKIQKNDRRINNLSEARGIVRWLFNDASVSTVSTVFELNDQYVVAAMTGETEEGLADLSDVRFEITTKVRNEKKGNLLFEKLSSLTGTMEDIADGYGGDARLLNSADLKLGSNNLPNVGIAPEAIGRVFSLTPGARSEPIKEENGVIIVELNELPEVPEIADFAMYSNQIDQRRTGRTSYNLDQFVREIADIQDYRYKFY